MKNILYVLTILIFNQIHSQTKTTNIDKIIDKHLNELRLLVGKEAKVFFAFDYEFKKTDVNEQSFIIQPYINPSFIKDKDSFFVRFLIVNKNEHNLIEAINFRIKKIGRRNVEFVNMGNGKEYSLD